MSYSLLDLFKLEEKKSYAIVGNSKNAGKTTVLNKLLEDISNQRKVAGISSIGWDGETIDRVYKTEKPAVNTPKGTIIATCKQLLPISAALFKIHFDTGIETILGSIYIIEALSKSNIEIVGPRDLPSARKLMEKLKEFSDYVILDGALNRNTSASSLITDGFILSLLYSGKESLTEFEKSIKLYYEKYSKFPVIDKIKINLDKDYLLDKNVIAIGFDNKIQYLDFQNPIHNEDKINNIEDKPKWIYLPGSLTDITFEKLSNFFTDIDIIVDDFTKNFLSSRVLTILKNRNCNIYYLFNSKLVGVTISTWSSKGYTKVMPKKLFQVVESIFQNYPVIDLFYN